MKILFMVFIVLFLIPQTISAQTYFLSVEGAGAFLKDTKIMIAESQDRVPVYMRYKDRPTFRIGGGIKFNEKFDLGIFYTHFKNIKQRNDNYAKNTLPIGHYEWDGRNFIFRDQPSTTGVTEVDLKFHTVDFELGYTIKFDKFDMRLMTGIRYAKYNNNLDSKIENYCMSQWVNSLRRVDEFDCNKRWAHLERNIHNRVSGVGPRLGVSFSVPFEIAGNKFKWISNTTGALLFTTQDFEHVTRWQNWNHTNQDKPAYLVNGFRKGYDRNDNNNDRWSSMSYTLGLEKGIQYSVPLSEGVSLDITAGYRYEGHFNTIYTSALTLPPLDRFGQYGSHADDIHIHGPFLRAIINF